MPTGPGADDQDGDLDARHARASPASARAEREQRREQQRSRGRVKTNDVLVAAEDVDVRARHGDHAAVGGREHDGDPEAAEVAGLPRGRQPEVAHLERAAEPDQVQVGERRRGP